MKSKYTSIALTLLISLFIYLFYRTNRTLVNQLLISIISFQRYSHLKTIITQTLPLPPLIIYSLPEGLWVFCITLTSKKYFISVQGYIIKLVCLPLAFSIGLELLQLLHITNGRFDVMDILVAISGWLAGRYLYNKDTDLQNVFSRLDLNAIACVGSYCIVYLAHVFIN